jgi:hypothetical protein
MITSVPQSRSSGNTPMRSAQANAPHLATVLASRSAFEAALCDRRAGYNGLSKHLIQKRCRESLRGLNPLARAAFLLALCIALEQLVRADAVIVPGLH